MIYGSARQGTGKVSARVRSFSIFLSVNSATFQSRLLSRMIAAQRSVNFYLNLSIGTGLICRDQVGLVLPIGAWQKMYARQRIAVETSRLVPT